MVSQLKGGGPAGTATARKISVLLGVGRSLPSRRLHDGARRDSRSCCSTKSTNGCSAAALSSPIGDLIGEVCFAGEMGGDPIDVGKTIRIRHCANRSGWREAFKECAPI